MKHKIFTEDYVVKWTDKTQNIDAIRRTENLRALIQPLNVTTILEVGCNRGYNLEAIKSFGQYRVQGIDNSLYAVKQSTIPEVHLGNMMHLDFMNRQFDLVFSYGALSWLEYKQAQKAVAEMKRVSKKYVMIIEHSFPDITHTSMYGNEILLCHEGQPMFWVRCYNWAKSAPWVLTDTKYMDEPNSIMMTSWLFERLI